MIPCTTDPERWFPDEDTPEEEVDDVVAECYACPARLKCLEHALTVGEPHGIWGGWTEEQRAELSSRRERVST